MRAFLIATVALVLLPGCTWTALRQQSVELSGAGADLRYREVIENLAMISANPWRLPSYSSIYAGAMDVLDSVQIDGSSTWVHSLPTPSGFTQQTMDIPASRAMKGTLTLDPTIVPEKLRALRAACQWAVFSAVYAEADFKLLEAYGADLPPGDYFGVKKDLEEICQYKWLGKGCSRRDVPKNACYWAHCGGKAYVWVCPEGMECFSRFVLVCQKIARVDINTVWKPQITTRTVKWSAGDVNNPRIQTVTAYVDDYGHLALGQNLPALPPKERVDNTGQNADLKATLSAAITVP
jgi:hypothetical protein